MRADAVSTHDSTMTTFALVKNLGWAHTSTGTPVLVNLVTFRDHDMFIPGGAMVAGIVDYTGDEPVVEWLHVLPRAVKRAARKALAVNDREEDRIRSEEDWTPSRLSYLPTSILEDGNNLYIVAFTGDEAVKAALAAGLEVRKGFGYAGPSSKLEEGYHGMIWARLAESQKHQEPVA